MGQYLLDTNAFTALYDPRMAQLAPRFRSTVIERITLDQELAIPAFVLYESRRGLEELKLRSEGARKIAAFDRMLRGATILGLDANNGWLVAAKLWASNKSKGTNIREGDLLVAATAVLHNRKLVTADQPLITAMRALGLDEVLDAHRVE
jgi:predicted nucleic acid-binding protein